MTRMSLHLGSKHQPTQINIPTTQNATHSQDLPAPLLTKDLQRPHKGRHFTALNRHNVHPLPNNLAKQILSPA